MATARAIVNASRCNSCRTASLRSFVPVTEAPHRSLLPITSFEELRIRSGGQRRAFSVTRYNQSDRLPSQAGLEQDVHGVEDVILDRGDEAPASAVTESIPWYLQVETPQRAPQSISDRQRIPDLPAGSPPLLQPLLERISVNLGLDDLTILDLRYLDPPPALGANLIMIIGTARSERHLHVSADRLCRWLRSDYKLTPFADGLLGRNELKLKLRRKARRSKLLRSVGASERENVDDGTRTGWVCVNVGRVEGDPNATQEVTATESFVGFGGDTQGVRLVVQMLTEGKREELDLEGLWGKMLDQKARRDAKTVELAERAALRDSVEDSSEIAVKKISNISTVQNSHVSSTRSGFQGSQARCFHTSATRLTADSSIATLAGIRNSELASNWHSENSNTEEPTRLSETERSSIISAVEAGAYESLISQLMYLDPAVLRTFVVDGGKELTLRAHLNHLRNCTREVALRLLGHSDKDVGSNPFLFSFFRNFPVRPKSYHWHHRLELHCYAIELGHPGYSKIGLLTLFTEMRGSFADIPERTLKMIFKAILSQEARLNKEPDFGAAIDILEAMNHYGYNICTEEIFTELLKATSPSGSVGPTRFASVFNKDSLCRERLDALINFLDIPFVNEDPILCVLEIFYCQGRMDSFWRLWHDIPLREARRTEKHYAFMFQCAVGMRDRKNAIKVLRQWIPEMTREDPPVKWTEPLIQQIKECIHVASPDVSHQLEKKPVLDTEWTRLWRRCDYMSGMQQEIGEKVKKMQREGQVQSSDWTVELGSLVGTVDSPKIPPSRWRRGERSGSLAAPGARRWRVVDSRSGLVLHFRPKQTIREDV